MEKLINMIKITERNSELPATNLETLGTYFLVLHPRDKGMNNAITKKANIVYWYYKFLGIFKEYIKDEG